MMAERIEALGHNLPVDVKRLIFRFDQHPAATLIKDLEFTRARCEMGEDTVLFLLGPNRCFKRLRQNGLEYVDWFWVRLWRTLEPEWTARSDMLERL